MPSGRQSHGDDEELNEEEEHSGKQRKVHLDSTKVWGCFKIACRWGFDS